MHCIACLTALNMRCSSRIDQFNRKKRQWPECKKNKRGSSSTASAAEGLGGTADKHPKRTRAKKAWARHNPRPSYVAEQSATSFHAAAAAPSPITLVPALYQVQHSLLSQIDKYVKGFFDSASTTAELIEAQPLVQWQWHNLSNRCRAASTVVRKQKMVQLPQRPNEPLPSARGNSAWTRLSAAFLKNASFPSLRTQQALTRRPS